MLAEIGEHKPRKEWGECPSCGSAPCGPHPSFWICDACEEDWPCATVQAVADELNRIATAPESFDDRGAFRPQQLLLRANELTKEPS